MCAPPMRMCQTVLTLVRVSIAEQAEEAEMTRRLLGAPPIAVQISFVNLKMQVLPEKDGNGKT